MSDESSIPLPQQPPAGDSRPTWLPTEFKTPDDLVKSYGELRKRFSRGEHKQAGAEQDQATGEDMSGDPLLSETTPSDSTPEAPPPSQQQAQNALKAAGIELDALSQEYQVNGSLSQQSYDKLITAGFPRALVDNYIAGQQARLDQTLTSIYQEAGGSAEKYQEMAQWMMANVPNAEMEVYNRIVSSSDLEASKFAVRSMYQRMQASDTEPKLIGGSRSSNSGDVFQSKEEVIAAVRDPRYKSDPAYRQMVEAKSARSNLF
jgi:hypothetical protein